MSNEERNDLRYPPLVAMNPMGKDHCAAVLDAYLALDAEAEAARASSQAAAELAELPGDFKIGLVLADDAMGGGTNRYTTEFTFFGFALRPRRKLRPWLTDVLWSSEAASAQGAREAALLPIHRTAHIRQHRVARTLGELLAQEGCVMASAGCTPPALDADDLAYTRKVIAPHLSAQDQPTVIACVFGDNAARTLGYTPQGLSERAGLALALHDAVLHGEARS